MSGPVRLFRNAPLLARNTFGVAAHAAVLAEVDDAAALPGVLSGAEFAGRAPLVLGGGSNLLFVDDPAQPLLALTGRGVRVLDDGDTAIVQADAGVQWHGFVLDTLERGLCGLENLALIPGTVGAAPIQNIGAYGVEVREFVHAVEAFEPATGQWRRFDRDACAFAYRDSLFKHEPDRFIVTAVEFALPRRRAPRLGYAGLGDELAASGIHDPTPRQVAEAVIAIRRRKLPDPAVLGNAGSFFKNPIVPAAQAQALLDAHPVLPSFPTGDTALRKLSAAWLIDACGWKGHRDGDAGVAPSHALVLVNHGNASGLQLFDLARRIADSVQARFGVALEPEPRMVGARW
ncbi:UDP-N-acetylenolpyruvoylglucosamine reductase [Lysobacter arseniciresistens ZS79]|uniref:UDP-N-acetylenolpyruvoylglucosamine reductase n=1 Tax=Lysobacter arseniciresistens ZS79 TaxID=913325 RepID=A0A0A0F4P8_9GAMM|nr:UDP-N-acetylmuramate dehydrogenase [Lysobacter arseniciresistens]KGM57495.1 UDP-N-acetylenolpyruvoylglucosamine reductase [Lysobacter arseniciresistens ZS79]